MATMKIKKGDMVKVIAGKDINSEGKVIAVNRKDGTVLVEGVNMVTKHTKPSMQNQQGGIVSITVAAVIVTGIIGAVIAPALIKLFRVKNPVEAGIAIGTCSHALGTTKALELGEVQGAMSGIAIGVAGMITVLLTMFL